MQTIERVTVTLPHELIKAIDERETNRSKFIADAVRSELARRQYAELQKSLQSPHAESTIYADQPLDESIWGLPQEDAEGLVDSRLGKDIQWVSGVGWAERPE